MAKLSVRQITDKMAEGARAASLGLAEASSAAIDGALLSMARLLDGSRGMIRKENEKDLVSAGRKGLSKAMIDRLTILDKTIDSMIDGLGVVAGLKSPVGAVYDERSRPNGLRIYKVKVPIGVIVIIYESRPNVTVDAAAICLKSQNAVILRGGSEAFHSNSVLAKLFLRALSEAGLPKNGVQLVPTTDRSAVSALLKKTDHVDLVIPRGGKGLIRTVVEESLIPVIKHYKGVCHVFVSRHADMEKAVPIVVNAKVQRPGVCNAMETLLIDSRLPLSSKKRLIGALIDKGVTLYGDIQTQKIDKRIGRAKKSDWTEEYLDLRCAVRSVNGTEEAIAHINTYGSHHTDSIVSESKTETERFLRMVDSSSVMSNASTRFSDGGEYGMGCEIGISTDKLHARGPMGVDDLTTYKWIVEGKGQIRA